MTDESDPENREHELGRQLEKPGESIGSRKHPYT